MLKRTILPVLVLLMIFSCSKEKLETQSFINQNSNEFTFQKNDSLNVSIDKAKEVADLFKYQKEFFDTDNNLKSSSNYEVDDVFIIPDENDEPAIYVINLLPKGYIIISATEKETPILGFSDNNSFDIDNLPLGMAEWFYDRMNKIQIIKNDENYSIPNDVTAEWDKFKEQNSFKSSDLKSTSSAETILEQYGPLLSTLWHQGSPFNDKVPLNCSGSKAPAGCVGIAVAQVLRYHAYPSSKYNWSIMPNIAYSSYSTGADEVANLIRDIGTSSYLDMDYGCDGSGAETGNAVNVFKNKFNYSSGGTYAGRSDEDAEPLVKADIKANRPVIMDGYHTYYTTTSGWWIFEKTTHYYENGHAWVCDGYKRVRKTLTIQIFGKYQSFNISNSYYHMNWGWAGIGQRSYDNDGWFLFSNIEIEDPNAEDQKGKGYYFQYKRKYLTNIHP